MKPITSGLSILTLSIVLATRAFAADSDPRECVSAAAKALAAKPNYSWKTTIEVPPDSQFRPGPTEGKTELSGLAHVTMSFGDTPVQVVVQGDKGAALNREGQWQSASDLEGSEGPGRWLAWMIRGVNIPAAHVADILKESRDLKMEGDTCKAILTEDGAKALLSFRRRAAGGQGPGPDIRNAKGTVTFWVKDGMLAKYEYKVSGVMNFNGEDRDLDRTTTVEIKNVGSTTVTVPDEARKKLG